MSVNTEYKIYWKIDFLLWSGDYDKPFSSDFLNELPSIEPYFQSSFGIKLTKKLDRDWWSDYYIGTWGLLFSMEKPLLYGEFFSSLSRKTIDDIALELFKFKPITEPIESNYVEIVTGGYVFWVYYTVPVCDCYIKSFLESDYESLVDLTNISLIEEKNGSFRLGLPCFCPYKFTDDHEYEKSPMCGFLPNDTIKEQFSLFDLQVCPGLCGGFAHVFLTPRKMVLWSNVEFPKPMPKILQLVMFLLDGRPRIICGGDKPCDYKISTNEEKQQ